MWRRGYRSSEIGLLIPTLFLTSCLAPVGLFPDLWHLTNNLYVMGCCEDWKHAWTRVKPPGLWLTEKGCSAWCCSQTHTLLREASQTHCSELGPGEWAGTPLLFRALLAVVLFLVLVANFDAFVTPWTVAHQAPLSVGFSRQEDWSGLPFPSPGDLLDPGIEPVSPALAGSFFTTELPGRQIDRGGGKQWNKCVSK